MSAPPVDTFPEAAPLLRRPFTKEAIRWKVQTQYPKDNPTFALVVAYIDARLVVERLNHVIPDWSDSYELVATGQGEQGAKQMRCDLTVAGITRTDVGKGTGPEAMKAAFSDSLKRAAVKFGVGVSVYAIPIQKMQCGVGPGKLPVKGPDGKKTARIEDPQLRHLAAAYESWLNETGRANFGEPIDHGDVLGSAGEAPPIEDDHEDERPETSGKEDLGRKISAQRAQKLADLFQASPLDPVDLAIWLNRACGVEPVPQENELADHVKRLKTKQADDLEQWITTASNGSLA